MIVETLALVLVGAGLFVLRMKFNKRVERKRIANEQHEAKQAIIDAQTRAEHQRMIATQNARVDALLGAIWRVYILAPESIEDFKDVSRGNWNPGIRGYIFRSKVFDPIMQPPTIAYKSKRGGVKSYQPRNKHYRKIMMVAHNVTWSETQRWFDKFSGGPAKRSRSHRAHNEINNFVNDLNERGGHFVISYIDHLMDQRDFERAFPPSPPPVSDTDIANSGHVVDERYIICYRHDWPNGLSYVGIGTYSRPFMVKGRNTQWHRQVEQFGHPTVSIIAHMETRKEAATWEKETIAKFGRIGIEPNGILVNEAQGG